MISKGLRRTEASQAAREWLLCHLRAPSRALLAACRAPLDFVACEEPYRTEARRGR